MFGKKRKTELEIPEIDELETELKRVRYRRHRSGSGGSGCNTVASGLADLWYIYGAYINEWEYCGICKGKRLSAGRCHSVLL